MSSPSSEARFTINVREGIVELEGKESFVDKHLEKFEEIFKVAVKEVITSNLLLQQQGIAQRIAAPALLPPQVQQEPHAGTEAGASTAMAAVATPPAEPSSVKRAGSGTRHSQKAPSSPAIHPIPVDLKAGNGKVGLREFYAEKKPSSHYEKAAVFAYYLTKFNRQSEVRYGEMLSCYEEVNEKKPSVTDIVKNSIRYKGWLEPGSEKFAARLTISGENFVKFDLPAQAAKAGVAPPAAHGDGGNGRNGAFPSAPS